MIDSLLLYDLHRGPPQPLRTPFADIMRQVGDKHGVSVAELLSPARSRCPAWARQEVMYRARRETSLSLPQIGQRLGNRDHSTVLHGVRAHEKRMGGERGIVAS